MWIWKPLKLAAGEADSDRGRVRHMIAIMNLISVHMQVINAEPCDLAAGKMDEECEK